MGLMYISNHLRSDLKVFNNKKIKKLDEEVVTLFRQIEELKQEIETNGVKQAQVIDQLQVEIRNLQELKETFGEKLEEKLAEDEAKANRDKDPWVDIKSARYTEERGLEIELDWNDKFIEYLAKAGFNNSNPELSVKLWMASLSENIIQNMSEDDIKNSFYGVADDDE